MFMLPLDEILRCCLGVFCVCLLKTDLLSVPVLGIEQENEQTVYIGVILDSADPRASTINRSIDLAMRVANETKSPKMHPIRDIADYNDSFKIAQTLYNLIDREPIALFGTSQAEVFPVFESYSRAFRIPIFIPTQTQGAFKDTNSYIVNMYPSFIDAVIDVIKFFKWKRIFYLFDSDDALWRMQKMYKAFDKHTRNGERELVIEVVRIWNIKNCRDLIWKLDRQYNYDERNFVLDLLTLQDYDIFMKQVVEVGMNKDGYNYILGTLDINGMNKTLWKSFTYGGANVTGFRLVRRNHRHDIVAVLFPNDRQPSVCIKVILQQENVFYENASKRIHVVEAYTDIKVEVALTVDGVAVLTTAMMQMIEKKIIKFRRGQLHLENGQLVMEQILNVTLEGGNEGLSGRVAFDSHGNRKGYRFDIFHLSYKNELREVANWQHGIGIKDMLLEPPFDKEKEKPLNATMIVTTIISEPFVQLKEEENGKPLIGNNKYEGYCIDLMKLLAQRINLTYEIKLVDDDEFGSKPDNQSEWNGLIGELLTKKADIALASLTITHKRQEAVYFTKPFMTTGISLMIKKPEKERPGVFSFMQPLSIEVWGCIMCGFFAVSFILYMVGRFSPYEWRNTNNGEKAPSDTFSFANNIWYSLGALLQQGPDEFPRSLSGRVLASAWWFFTLITISSYTANLAACLTLERLVTPINSVDDLVKQSKIKYGTQEKGSTFEFFQASTVPVYKQMYNVMQETSPSVYVDNSQKGWNRVINGRGRYAFLLESSSNNYFNQRKPCKTMKVGRNLDQKGYGIATRKESPLSEKLNIALLEIREKGDLLKLEQKWWYQKGQCGGSGGAGKGKTGLNLSNVSGIFHILIGGLVLAVFISLTQMACYSFLKSRSKKKSYSVNSAIRVLEAEPLSGNRYSRPIEQRYNTF